MRKINSKGYALVIVVIAVAVVITLTSTMLFTLNTEIRLNSGTEEKEKANYLAQAGIEHGLIWIEKNNNPTDIINEKFILLDEQPEGGNLYQYWITKLTETTLSATGEIKSGAISKQSITISATIDKPSGKVTIIKE